MTTQQEQLMAQLVELTEAVKTLASRPPAAVVAEPAAIVVADPQVTEGDRIRQRVTFAYQALGTVSGRVSSATGREFDVPVVAAGRRRRFIVFDGLPPGADWVELRDGARTELLRIFRGDGQNPPSAEIPDPEFATVRGRSDLGVVRTHVFRATDPIGSMVFLRHRRGPLVAFGPRLAPVRGDAADLND